MRRVILNHLAPGVLPGKTCTLLELIFMGTMVFVIPRQQRQGSENNSQEGIEIKFRQSESSFRLLYIS